MSAGFALRTARIEASAPRPGELATLRTIATTPAVGRMLLIFSPGMSDAAFAATHPLQAGAPPFRLAVREAGRVIGSVGVGAGRAPPIYYFLAPDRAGRGLASEMVPVFCAAVLARFPLEALTAEVFDDNPASARVLARAGFRCTGPVILTSAIRPGPESGTLWRRDQPA